MKMACVMAIGVSLLAARPAHAQYCWSSTGTTADARYCNALAMTAQLVQPAVGIAFAAGNPVPGASSTIGMRIRSVPRMSLAVRLSGAFVNLPDVQRFESTGTDRSVLHSINVDAAVGVLGGWSIAPTIGGFGSLDLIASAGKLSMPDAFTESPASWGVGARLGILRESFTAPGVSVTGMYRRVGDIEYGGRDSARSDGMFALRDNSVLSVRAVVGKRLFVLGANVGVGYDKLSSEVESHRNDIAESLALLERPALEPNRFTAFANVTWTLLILNGVIEGGYQRGSDTFSAPLPSGQESRTENSTYYGSLAIRLAL